MNENIPTLGEGLPIDLPKLMETRALIQAGSGGGKSWVMRRLIEQTAPHVQQFVIDIEGEFASLREKFEFLLCAPVGGDVVANPHTAAHLARALSESGCSAVLDISELSAGDRLAFVDRFIMALINQPKAKWRPAMIHVDEASFFAPQVGGGSALDAMIALAQRGRKRGLCLVAATQRISNLNKNVAAELLNKLTGRTGLDVDIKRAADDLGMNLRDATDQLRTLPPGQFFMYGPALCEKITRIKVGEVVTSHPKVGHRSITPPPPSAGLLEKLSKFEAIHLAVEQEEQTVENLLAKITRLEAGTDYPTPEAYQAVCDARTQWQARAEEAETTLDAVRAALGEAAGNYSVIIPEGAINPEMIKNFSSPGGWDRVLGSIPKEDTRLSDLPKTTTIPDWFAKVHARAPAVDNGSSVTKPQQRILDALAKLDILGIPFPKKHVLAMFAGASSKSSAYSNNLGSLRTAGRIEYQNGGVRLTIHGHALAFIPDLISIQEEWMQVLTKPQQNIMEVLLKEYPSSLHKVTLAQRAGASATSSAFSNNLGWMRTLGILDYPSQGHVAATQLFTRKRA